MQVLPIKKILISPDKTFMKNLILSIFTMFSLIGCDGISESPIATKNSDGAILNTGDIVVTSNVSDSAIVLDKDGNFKRVLFNADNSLEQVTGITWNADTNEVVIVINGAPDRVIGISAIDGSEREIIRNAFLNGTTNGIVIMPNNDYVVVETSNLERFTATGTRINDGDFPRLSIMTTMQQLNPLSSGDFVACATGSDRVRIYNDSGIQQQETASGIAATTNAYGCGELPNGNIVTSWDGTSDSVTIYDSTLGSELFRFSDTGKLSAPRGIGIKSNGNILVTDAGFDRIIELTSEAEFVRVFSSAFLSDPYQILEIPEF